VNVSDAFFARAFGAFFSAIGMCLQRSGGQGSLGARVDGDVDGGDARKGAAVALLHT
jgi:hypothetical protein